MRPYKNANILSCATILNSFITLIFSAIYPFSAVAQPFAYVASIAGSTVTVVNVANNSIVAAPYIPGGMTGIAASPNGSIVYVTAQSFNQVEIFSTASNSVVGAIGVGATPVAVAFTPNGALAYVANQGSNTVTVINTASSAAIATIPVGTRPSSIAVNPSGTRALVANTWDTYVSVIDTASSSIVANIAAGFGLSSIAISPNGAFAYATNQSSNSVAVISLASNTLVGNIPVQQNPSSIAVTPNGARIFVTNGNSNTVSVIDSASSTVIATIGVGANPTSIAITPDGTRAEVTNAQGYSASLLDANSLYVISTLDRVGVFPSGVTIPPAGGGSIISCNYSVSPASQAFLYTGGSGAAGVNISAGAQGCNWNATSNASWITLTSGLSGLGNGTTYFNVAANLSPTPRSGTITIAGLPFTVSQDGTPVLNQAPTADSVSPASGSGPSQIFQATVSDPAGFGNINYLYLQISSALNASPSCWAVYDRASNGLYLFNDMGTALLGPRTPGAAGSLSNGQCTLDGGASSVAGSGNSLVVRFAVSFQPGYAGLKSTYLLAVNNSNLNSGWQTRGSWTVPSSGGGANVAPTADAVGGWTTDGPFNTFYTTSSDSNGSSDLAWIYLLLNDSLTGSGACYAVYNRPSNMMYLLDDAGNALLGPLPVGVPGTLTNSQCLLDGGASSARATNNSVVVNFGIDFKYPFFGVKNTYLLVIDTEGLNSGWQNRGTFNVYY